MGRSGSMLCALTAGALAAVTGGGSHAMADDFRWMHGANYIPTYAATDVEMWLRYDHETIARELGYAEKLGLNCVRVFLQSLVYQHDPEASLARFEDFLATADAHELRVMPVLFDSCFGVSPSLESRHMWVANPGPDRMAEEWWPGLDAYVEAVVSAHRDDDRIALWDVMNEPTATPLAAIPEGKAEIDAFVAHYCGLVRQLDPTHAITVGVATWDNSDVIDLVDVLSCHSYAAGVEAFREALAGTRSQARAAGKPWIVSECCNVAAGNTYEMCMPVLRELGVGHTVWALTIGREMFRAASGLVYPDGTVRRIAEVEAVMDAPADGFEEKPDADGWPVQHDVHVRLGEYLEASARDGVTETTWRERHTLAEALLAQPGSYGGDHSGVAESVAQARKAYDVGRKEEAFATIAGLIERAAGASRANPPAPEPPAAPTATVYRDVYGVPHIYADTEAAGAYAIAQAQCEDMGMQVFDSLRIAAGRGAEAFGESHLGLDRSLRLWRLPETAEGMWRASPQRTKRFIQGYCDGLNDYRAAHPQECANAIEIEPVHVLAFVRFTDLEPSSSIIELNANAALGQPPPELDSPDQSSTWAIGPTRTASGRPILFIDPHWPAQGRTSWWEFDLHVGRMQVGGFAVPGMPFVGLGYTDGVAWAATAGGADSADVFELRIDPKDPNQYWYDGVWKEMEVRTVTIRVKTEAGDIQEREITLRETVHGPVVREEEGRTFAGAICGVRDTLKLEQWLAVNRAKSGDEIREALRMDQAAWLNVTYASRDGHFGYIQTGMCPARGTTKYTWLGAHDGTRSSEGWQGRIPFDELPQLHDPSTGWLQSCNTAANYVTEGQTIEQDDFPPGAMCGHVAPADGRLWRGRGMRCFEVMPKMRNVTHEEARAFALDTYAPAGPIWAGPLVAAYEARGNEVADPDLSMKMLADAVREWDCHIVKSSVGATAFRYWRMEYQKLHPEAFGSNEAYGAPQSPEEQLDAVKALRAAADHLKEAYGSPLVPWGQILRLRRGGLDLPLDGDVGFFGGTECLRSTGTQNEDGEGHFVFDGGQVIPTVVELTDPIQVWSIVPYGQSRRPESPHYSDQMHLYSESRMRPAWHGWAQLGDHVESKVVVEPRAPHGE